MAEKSETTPNVEGVTEKTVTSKSNPTQSPVQPSAPSSGSNKTLIIVIVLLLLCCCVTIAGIMAAVVIYGKKDIVTPTTSPAVISNGGGTTTATPAELTLSQVESNYMAATSYHFAGDAKFEDGSSIEFKGEFQAPDTDHYITTEIDTKNKKIVTEEISINGVYYIKEDNGTWAKTTEEEAYNAGIQRSEMLYFFKNVDMKQPASTSTDGYLYYTYTDKTTKETLELYINKESGLPAQLKRDYLTDSGENVKEVLTFTEYNDSEINIVAPKLGK